MPKPTTRGAPLHLFVVEDDGALRDMLVSYLQRQNFDVTPMASAEELLRRMHRLRPDLIVLDVGLPGESGLQACRQLRAEGDQVPIILLTARSEEVDRIVGLEMGADDYMSKPFSARELVARMRAVLRRATTARGAPLVRHGPVMIGDLRFDPASRSLRAGDQERVLSTVEFTLLAELVTNAGIPISRERLLAASHLRGDETLLRTVDTAIMRLRRVVEPNPAEPRYIQTVRGHGYVFVPDRGKAR